MTTRRLRLQIIVLAMATAALLLLASSASAADSLYWANEESPISQAALDGSGGSDIGITSVEAENFEGIAIDPANERIYWANWASDLIVSASLGGGPAVTLNTSGATVSSPEGIAVDPATGRVYWANGHTQGSISYANLDGSGGGDLNTTGATVENPWGVAIDTANGRIYWSNGGAGLNEEFAISWAALDGSGAGDFNTAASTGAGAQGIAIDSANGRIYWGNSDGGVGDKGVISYVGVNGGGVGDLNTGAAPIDSVNGLAIDAATGKIYWSNRAAGSLASANLDGSGGSAFEPGAATVHNPGLVALYKAPHGSRAPTVSGAAAPGSTLTCSGEWAADDLGAQLYQSPNSVARQWTFNGMPIAGATGTTYGPSVAGTYACTETAVNRAGSSSQTSAPFTVAAVAPATVSIVKVKLNRKKGTATIVAKVSGPGSLTVTGKGIAKAKGASHGAGAVKLTVRASGKAKKRLLAKGKATVKASIRFAPGGGGAAATAAKTIVLKRSR